MSDMKTTEWHLDKRFTVGNVITTISVVAGLIIYGQRLETRIQLLEATQSMQVDRINAIEVRTDKDIRDFRKDMVDRLNNIDQALRRLEHDKVDKP